MTRVVQGLETQGLVARRPDPADGRRVVLRATPRGRRSMLAARERRLKRLRAKLARLSKRDLSLLSRAAERIEILARGETHDTLRSSRMIRDRNARSIRPRS